MNSHSAKHSLQAPAKRLSSTSITAKASVALSHSPTPNTVDLAIDAREQLVNNHQIGPIGMVSIPEAMITSLHAIMQDIDPGVFRSDAKTKRTRVDPVHFYDDIVKPMLERNSLLRRAEVRCSGTGLHVLIWLAEPILFDTDGERERWKGIAQTIQRLLPSDSKAPGLTALTRPVGSINGKNHQTVTRLAKGEPVPAAEVIALFDEVRTKPFATVAGILFGEGSVTPCPSCGIDGSSMGVMDRIGKCYAECGKVGLAALYDHFLMPFPAKKGK